MADSRNDKSAYDKSRYTSRARERRASDVAPAPVPPAGQRRTSRPREERSAAADLGSEYSRDNAARRYATRERHASNGRESVAHRLERMRGGAAAAGGTRWGKRIALAVVIVVVLAIVGWYLQVSLAMRPSDDVSGSVSGPEIGKPYYVLLMGSDSRDEAEDTARADSMILCRVDEAAKQVTMVSMPRDLLVEIPGHGKGKLNSALAYEGYSGAIDAVSKVAGVPISYYATIYFSGFEKLVDDLGGVTVQVPEGTYYDGVWVPAGDAPRINGKEALVLARCRHGNPPDQGAYAAGDYQRTKNQRNLMKAIVKEIMGKPAWQVPGLVSTVSGCIETNMPAWKMAELAVVMRGMDTEKMYSASAPASSKLSGGVWYEILDDAAWKKMMARVEAGQDPNA